MQAIALVTLLVAAVSAGGYGYSERSSSHAYEAPLLKAFTPIVKLVGSTDNAGNYNFDSEGGDGTKLSETGSLKVINGETGAVKVGSVSWTSPEGQHFSYSYSADETGFHVKGEHLPTPPPTPEEILKVLPLLPKLDPREYDFEESKPQYEAYHVAKPAFHHVSHRPQRPVAVPAPQIQMPSFMAKPQGPLMPAVSISSKPLPPTGFVARPPTRPDVPHLVPVLAGPPAPPLRTDIETSDFVIHSDNANTFFRIGSA